MSKATVPISVERIDAYRWRVPKRGGMRTDGLIFADEVLMSGLEGEQIAKVVKQNYGAIEGCVVEAAKVGNVPGGKQHLILTVQPKGLVSNTRFKNGVTNASPVGECIRKRAKKWKFPPFAGDAFDIEIPMVLSVGL